MSMTSVVIFGAVCLAVFIAWPFVKRKAQARAFRKKHHNIFLIEQDILSCLQGKWSRQAGFFREVLEFVYTGTYDPKRIRSTMIALQEDLSEAAHSGESDKTVEGLINEFYLRIKDTRRTI